MYISMYINLYILIPNLKHKILNTHKNDSVSGQDSEEIFEIYAQIIRLKYIVFFTL